MDQPITPDWSALPDEILCPLCRYNLRGLVEPRCPECGYSFDWSEVLDPNRRLHPYLFEHHPERNVWSFFRTLVGGLRPWRFWSTLHPAQPADARRLTLYHLLICALLLLPALTRLVAVTYFPTPAANYDWDDGDLDDVIDTAISKSPGPALVWWFLLPVYRWKAGLVLWGLPVLGLLMPYAMVLPLSVFQWSMHKARVGYEHVRRCVIYSADATVWLAVLLCGLVVLFQYDAYHNNAYLGRRNVSDVFAVAAFGSFPAAWVLMSWRLASAYKRYLRFNKAWAVILSADFILLLVLLALALGIRVTLPIQ